MLYFQVVGDTVHDRDAHVSPGSSVATTRFDRSLIWLEIESRQPFVVIENTVVVVVDVDVVVDAVAVGVQVGIAEGKVDVGAIDIDVGQVIGQLSRVGQVEF